MTDDNGEVKKGPSLKTRALSLLARREHTRVELAAKLTEHSESREVLDLLLDELAARGWLSDTRAVEQVLHKRRQRYGSLRIRQELLAKGVPEELVAETLPSVVEGDFEAACAIWRRKFKAPPENANDRARQLRFLLGRGFSSTVAQRVVRTAGGMPEE